MAPDDTAVLEPAPPPRSAARVTTAITLILAAALCAVTAFADGGMRLGATTGRRSGSSSSRSAVVAAALIAAPQRDRLHGALGVAAMLVLAIAAWSITWAVNPSDAWIDANRHLAYLAAFAAAVAFAHLAHGAGPQCWGPSR